MTVRDGVSRASRNVAKTTGTAKTAKARKIEAVTVQHIPLALIDGSPHNARRKLSDLDDLAASIQAHGLLQPLLVRRRGRRYEVIAGNRRLEAIRRLEWPAVPVIVRSAYADEATILALVENLQRSDLRPSEEAAALETLIRERGWSTHQVAAAINRSQAFVSKRLRVFEDPLLAPAVLANQLPVSTAEELLSIPADYRYELLSTAIEQNWDRQDVRDAARNRFAANRTGGRPAGLTSRLRQLRTSLRDVEPSKLTDADRRELRLLFSDLAMLARAPSEPRERTFPPLPAT